MDAELKEMLLLLLAKVEGIERRVASAEEILRYQPMSDVMRYGRQIMQISQGMPLK